MVWWFGNHYKYLTEKRNHISTSTKLINILDAFLYIIRIPM